MVNLTKIIYYDPHNSRKARRIQLAQWEDLRKRLEILWLREDRSLEEVMTTMAQDYGFSPRCDGLPDHGHDSGCNPTSQIADFGSSSRRQYVSKFAAWKWHKAVPAKVMRSALRRASKEPERQTKFKFQGREISQENMTKFRLRHPTFDPASSPTSTFPSELECLSTAVTVFDFESDQVDLALGWSCGNCDLIDKNCQVHKQEDFRKFLCMDATGPVADTLNVGTLDEIEEITGPSSALMIVTETTAFKKVALDMCAHYGHLVLEGRKRLLPQFDWIIARAYENLALAYTKLKRYDESKSFLLIAVSKWATAPVSDRHAVYPLLKSLVNNSLKAGDIQTAIDFCEDVIVRVQTEVGLQHYRVWLIYGEIGEMFADHGHPRVQEKLMQELSCGIQPSLFEPSNGIIARFLGFCCDYLTSKCCRLALQNDEIRSKRNLFSELSFVWNEWDPIYYVLLAYNPTAPQFDPCELYMEILATTGLDRELAVLTCMNVFEGSWPASASHCKSSFQQICAAVGALRSSENIMELWLKACPDFLLWDPESKEAEQARSGSKHKGRKTSAMADISAPVESHQTRPSSLPVATSTLSDLDCFFDFTAFPSPSPNLSPTNLSPEYMRSSLDMVSTPRVSNHPSSFASMLANPRNSVLDDRLYEEMD